MSTHAAPLNFQSIIFTLQTYWASRGCLIGQPYYSQVGAGTMNPSTFLRVLGPEPWRVAYVEPSVRPDDGRYGVNPNRLQQHHQFQVILKPDPGNPQELYLESLVALGIDPKLHDIRFVEDNWESPALSAWGLGWEVWLDGQEITQFTYFQQSGGIVLDVPSVEITYGLERIAMTLQRVRDFKQIRWNEERSYGDIYQVAEREHSTYYYEVADVARMREMFQLFEAEANLALERGLVLPAYDNIIKCSHTFNVLDARGAVGFTERQALFGKMRDLSRRVSEAYLAQRAEMGHPWLRGEQPELSANSEPAEVVAAETADFLLEIGTEELPTADLNGALAQLRTAVEQLLRDLRLGYLDLTVEGTPRRLNARIRALQTRQEERILEVKGPSADRAFDAAGLPTKAAEGFARSRGVNPAELETREVEGGLYVFARVKEEGKPASQLLAEALPNLIGSIRFTKGMRWNQTGVSFSRPVRWIVALLDSAVIPFSFAGVSSGRTTRGLRFSEPASRVLRDSGDYLDYMQAEGIILNPEERRQRIWQGAQALAEKTGGGLKEDPALLDEVANLAEKPLPLLASFEKTYLESLPEEVLIGVMKKHQRYFPVFTRDGQLSPYFIVVRNGDVHGADVVVDGNLQVVHARFADAAFFIQEDLQQPLEAFVPRLEQLTFQRQLGSMLDKTQRIQRLVPLIAERLGLDSTDRLTAERVALLCKADLATEMVVEMTSLQGVMGRYYALRSGETEATANAIFEHYLPRTAEDDLPQGNAGMVVGIADRLDSIIGLFTAGLAPSGNKDPFALRRSALGLAQLLIGRKIDFDLAWGLQAAAELLPLSSSAETGKAALEFIAGRLRGLLLDAGYRYDIVEAVLHTQAANPYRAACYAKTLTTWVTGPHWAELLPAYSRSYRITRDLDQRLPVEAEDLVESEEKALFEQLRAAEKNLQGSGDLDLALNQVLALVEPINLFFDRVLVMAEDAQLRQSRLGMLQRIVALLTPLVDLSALENF
jgi:glycyl-tRNA synthetase